MQASHMKTRSSGKAVEVENNGDGAEKDICPPDEDKSAGRRIKAHKRKPNSDAAAKEVEETQQEAREKLSVSKDTKKKNKEVGAEKEGKIAHFADNVEKNEQRIAGGQWHTVFEELKG